MVMLKKIKLWLEIYFWWRWPGVYLGTILTLAVGVRWLERQWWLIRQDFWPLTVFWPKFPGRWELVAAAGLVLAGWQVIVSFEKERNSSLGLKLVALILGLNLIQGWRLGVVYPLVGGSGSNQGYWQDANYISSAGKYLRHFSQIQTFLSHHGRVHPPGASLLVWSLKKLTRNNPSLVSLGLASLGLTSLIGVYRLARIYYSPDRSKFLVVLYALLPAVMIYAVVTLDMVIASGYLWSLFLWLKLEEKRQWLTAILLAATMMLSYASVWFLLMIVCLGIFYGKMWQKKIKSLFFWLVVYGGVVYGLLGFNYFDGLLTAMKYEGLVASGWWWTTPISGGVTRLQAVIEPLVYLGPWMTGCLWLGSKICTPRRLWELKVAAITAFLGFIFVGAYYTGETARGAIYLIPILVVSLGKVKIIESSRERRRLLGLLLGQSVLMQLLGFFSW